MRFKYRPIRNLTSPFSKKLISRPIIPISIRSESASVRYEALIDSGADFTILPIGLTEILNINPEDCREIYFSGIDGEAIKGIAVEVIIEIANREYKTNTVFADITNRTTGILGELGFFDQFVVKFDLSKKEIEVTSKK